jgi:Tol biopolymer transport system component
MAAPCASRERRGVRATAARPGGQDWILSLPVADTGAIDLFHADADGKLRRLTYTKGDEQAPSWSPDGKYAAMTSSQWTKYGRYDVAVIDVSNEKVRQLTSGEDSDTDPMWSPDGTRIAFIRRYWITGSDSLCSV